MAQKSGHEYFQIFPFLNLRLPAARFRVMPGSEGNCAHFQAFVLDSMGSINNEVENYLI